MANTQKQNIVDILLQKFEETTNFALIKFEKTTHKDLEDLRKSLLKADASIRVIKNTLFEKAVNKLSAKQATFKAIRDAAFPLKESTAVLFLKNDISAGLKALHEFAKKNDSIAFKFGLIDDVVYNSADLGRIAQLPGKDQLIAKLIGVMKNPMTKTVYTLKNPMQKFVYILSQKSQQA